MNSEQVDPEKAQRKAEKAKQKRREEKAKDRLKVQRKAEKAKSKKRAEKETAKVKADRKAKKAKELKRRQKAFLKHCRSIINGGQYAQPMIESFSTQDQSQQLLNIITYLEAITNLGQIGLMTMFLDEMNEVKLDDSEVAKQARTYLERIGSSLVLNFSTLKQALLSSSTTSATSSLPIETEKC